MDSRSMDSDVSVSFSVHRVCSVPQSVPDCVLVFVGYRISAHHQANGRLWCINIKRLVVVVVGRIAGLCSNRFVFIVAGNGLHAAHAASFDPTHAGIAE